MTRQEILSFAKELEYDNIRKMKITYKGYTVYKVIFNGGVACVGLPLCVLVKGEEIRMTTPEEACEIQRLRFAKKK